MDTMREERSAPPLEPLSQPEKVHVSAVMIQRNGEVAEGRTAIREHLAGLLAIRPKMKIQHRKTLRAGRIAVLVSDWDLEGFGPGGESIRDTERGSSRSVHVAIHRRGQSVEKFTAIRIDLFYGLTRRRELETKTDPLGTAMPHGVSHQPTGEALPLDSSARGLQKWKT
jgi:hypothetical protein